MTIAIYPGSFDPITNGHLDILNKSLKIFDKVIIAVAENIYKKGFLSNDKRLQLIKECVENIPNVEVCSYTGLTTDFVKAKKANVIIRGIRTNKDFEYEKELALINFTLNSDIQTVFLLSSPEFSHISSTAVREIALYKGDLSKLVPKNVEKFIYD